jgi:hypothetical protein
VAIGLVALLLAAALAVGLDDGSFLLQPATSMRLSARSVVGNCQSLTAGDLAALVLVDRTQLCLESSMAKNLNIIDLNS